jgi:hypothetical protein
MALQQSMLESRRKELEDFRVKHCEKADDGTSILVPVDYLAAFRRLDDKTHKAYIAMSAVPRSFLVALISEYDAFLSALIRVMYTVKPEMLKGSEKSFTFAELLEFGSIDAARDHIIEKEAETLLRESHTKQFDWLENKLKIKLRTDLPAWAPFVEITERRNLFVHNDGIVTKQYLENCKEAKSDVGSAKVGDRLEVSHRYFIKAHETVSEIAVKLAYVLWNKLEPNATPFPQKHLSTAVVYELILQGRYRLAIQMATFGLKYMVPFASEYDRLTLTVNLAQAYKWSGDHDKCSELLAIDWSASRNEFQLCVCALKDDVEGAIELMKTIGKGSFPDKNDYREWPLFQELRKNEKVQQAFQEVFDEPFNQMAPKEQKLEEEGKKPENEKPAQESPDGPDTIH